MSRVSGGKLLMSETCSLSCKKVESINDYKGIVLYWHLFDVNEKCEA